MACSQPGGIARAPHLDGDTARSQRLRWPDHRGYPSAKTRRPADCVASSTTSECPKNRCFSRSSTPSQAPEGPQSIGNRSASTRPRSGTRTRSPSPRSSISPGRAFTACRRCSDKARDSFVGGDWCSASKPVDPIHVPVRPPARRSRHRQRWSPPSRRRCLDWAAPRGRRRSVVMHLLRPFTPPTCRSRSRVARGVGRAAAPPAPSSFSTAISNGWLKNIRRSNSSKVDSSRQNALIHNLPSGKNRDKADFGLRVCNRSYRDSDSGCLY